MANTMSYSGVLVITTCWCGIFHAMPKDLYDEACRTGRSTYCPMGHSGVYKNSENDRLKKEKALLQERLDAQVRQTIAAREESERIERSRRSTKAALTRTKNRIAAGACPRCSKRFPDLAAHMHEAHPEYAESEAK